MRLLKVMQRQDNYLQESYNQSRTVGLPVPVQGERYSQEPDQYSSAPSSTTSVQQNQPESQHYGNQQQPIKLEPTSSSIIYKDNRKGYAEECPESGSYSLVQQPQPRNMYVNQVSKTTSQLVQPSQPVMSSTQSAQNLFYENKVNKDSELQLSLKDRQNLMNEANSAGEVDIASVEEVVSTQETNSKLDLNLSRSDTTDFSERPMSSDKSHVCMTCYKAFKNKPQLTQHELVHNGIRKHICSYCEKSFKQLCHLNQHIRTHTGERPYKCIVEGCGRSFAQLSNLHHHQKNHEEHIKRDLSRQFRCVICDRSYANESSLRTHTLKLHVNLKSPEEGSSPDPPTKKRKKKASVDPTQPAVMNLSSDEEGPPSQVKIDFSLTRPSNQISSSSANQISSTTTNQIPASINQSTGNLVRSLLGPRQNEVISKILEKRLLADADAAAIMRSTASQHLPSPQYSNIDSSLRQEQNVTTFQSLPKVATLARPPQQQERVVYSQETFNPDRVPHVQQQQKGSGDPDSIYM